MRISNHLRGLVAVVALAMSILATSVATSGSPAGAESVTDDSAHAMVSRLYLAAFDRPAEGAGLAFWVDQVENGKPMIEVADHFAGSDEFIATYGELDHADFVDRIYQNVLQREGDAEGVAFWVGELDSENRTRGSVVLGVSDSAEFMARVVAEVDDNPVVRLYCAYFLRWPEDEGREFWRQMYADGMSLDAISQWFSDAPEFDRLYGELDNEEFVELLYLNAAARDADADGFANWSTQLNTNALNRGQVMLAFSESDEFIQRFEDAEDGCPKTAAQLEAEEVNQSLLSSIDEATLDPEIAETGVEAEINVIDLIEAELATSVHGFVLGGAGSGANTTDELSLNGGSLTVDPATGAVTYLPEAGFAGVDTIFVTVCDAIDGTLTPNMEACVTVELSVTVENDNTSLLELIDPLNLSAETSVEAEVTTVIDGLDLVLAGLLAEGEAVTEAQIARLAIVSAGANAAADDLVSEHGGTLEIDAATGEISYTPADGFTGTDTFQIQVCDRVDLDDSVDLENCVVTDVEVVVEDDNAALIGDIDGLELDGGDIVYATATSVAVDDLLQDELGEDISTSLIVVSAGADTGGTDGASTEGGTVSVAAGTGDVLYTPAADFVGTDTFNVLVCDQNDLTGEANMDSCAVSTVTVEVGHADTSTLDCTMNLLDLDVVDGESVLQLSLLEGGCLDSYLSINDRDVTEPLEIDLLDVTLNVNGTDVPVVVTTDLTDPQLLLVTIPDTLLQPGDEISISGDVQLLDDEGILADVLGLDLIDLLLGGLLGGDGTALLNSSLLDISGTVGSDGSLVDITNNSSMVEMLVDPLLGILIPAET